MTEGISLGYENEEDAQKEYDKLLNIKKDYFEIAMYLEPKHKQQEENYNESNKNYRIITKHGK